MSYVIFILLYLVSTFVAAFFFGLIERFFAGRKNDVDEDEVDEDEVGTLVGMSIFWPLAIVILGGVVIVALVVVIFEKAEKLSDIYRILYNKGVGLE